MSGVGDQGLTPDYVHPQGADDGSESSSAPAEQDAAERDAVERDAVEQDDFPSEGRERKREQHRVDPTKAPPSGESGRDQSEDGRSDRSQRKP